MKKYFLIFLVMLCFIASGCASKNPEISSITDGQLEGGTVMEVVGGKVLKIIDNKTVLLNVTKQYSKYCSIGDEILLHYTSISLINSNDYVPLDTNIIQSDYTPKIGDEIHTQFWAYQLTKKEEYKSIDSDTVNVYINIKPLDINAKITELRDINAMLVEITKTQGKYKAGDKMLIDYVPPFKTPTDSDVKEFIPEKGKTITAKIFDYNVTQKDGYNYVETSFIN